ncbi:hypothetical protein SAST39_03322 [Staphylococcus aureus]|nr:hypothetical protein AZ30_08300 [Staphylococcus aureus USA300-ISMMS1]AMV77610.1 hypothetical protein SAST40_03948 [Staphylococcus aureus]KIN24545.1 hypothetical protein AH72_08930 [Staphylococcus aureus MRSA_CVM43477]KST18187.1 hypothetical protein N924_01060 [Staphylococcus aureus MRSA_CVMN27231PS]AMV80151.1 hypothetical protein SAST41_03455 [Staphylococcus aureus]
MKSKAVKRTLNVLSGFIKCTLIKSNDDYN